MDTADACSCARLYLDQVTEGDPCGEDQVEVEEELHDSGHKRSHLHLLLH